ncbi:MAG: ADP-ribose pyrophosphatase [Firmicutes bacterium ADurb.Bin080]|nr:MAG: ADP-ribose pyrophosphatase [Firmicutes bacterium ADurb.Bin080]
MSNQIIKTQRENIVADNRWVTLYFDDVLFPNGKTGKYNRLVEKGGNGIVILPLDDTGQIGLINLYRYPIGSFSWELPRGFGSNTSIENNAAREMLEEMGLGFTKLIKLGSIHPNSGMLSTIADVVLVTGLYEYRQTHSDDCEPIDTVQFYSIQEITNMIKSGKITDGFTISAIMLAWVNDSVPRL